VTGSLAEAAVEGLDRGLERGRGLLRRFESFLQPGEGGRRTFWYMFKGVFSSGLLERFLETELVA